MRNEPRKTPNESVLLPPVEDAFLRTPVASAYDCTGYVVNMPINDQIAEGYEDLCNVPCTSSDVTEDHYDYRDETQDELEERFGNEEA